MRTLPGAIGDQIAYLILEAGDSITVHDGEVTVAIRNDGTAYTVVDHRPHVTR